MSAVAERPALELLIGRKLTQAEAAIDIVKLDRALAQAKDDLNAAIHAEMLHATLVWIANGGSPRLIVTPDMRAVLDGLYLLGAEEAWLELHRLGYDLQGRRAYIEEGPTDGDVPDYLRRNLRGIEIRIEDELVRTDLSGLASSAVAQAVMQLPGARDLASRAISTAMINGFASTFDQVADLVGGWQYTAILDGGTCDQCAPLDGTVYETLDDLFVVLPNYGPNPLCLGGGRCRCRAVPAAPGEPTAPGPPSSPRPSTVVETARLPARSIHGDVLAELDTARSAIAAVHKLPPDTPTVPIRIRSMQYGTNGHFDPNKNPPEIVISSNGDSVSLTFAHELGHAIDWNAIGDRGGMATEALNPSVRQLMGAIVDSEAVQSLLRMLSDPPVLTRDLPDGRTIQLRASREHLEYLLNPAELFARVYAQWVTERSGSRIMKAQLDRRLQDPYAVHWKTDDFEAIAAAMDALAREQGWTTNTPS